MNLRPNANACWIKFNFFNRVLKNSPAPFFDGAGAGARRELPRLAFGNAVARRRSHPAPRVCAHPHAIPHPAFWLEFSQPGGRGRWLRQRRAGMARAGRAGFWACGGGHGHAQAATRQPQTARISPAARWGAHQPDGFQTRGQRLWRGSCAGQNRPTLCWA